MCKIEIEKKNVEAAYKVADENGKKLLDALFGKAAKANTPNLDDYKSIKTYEDACEALGLTPIYSDENVDRAVCEHINDHWDYRQDLPKHIKALLKLETIAKALWGRNWEPVPDAEGKKRFWYPWFALWTKKEMEDLTPDQRGALLSAYALWCVCGFRLSEYVWSLLGCACAHWVPLVPRNGGESTVLWYSVR